MDRTWLKLHRKSIDSRVFSDPDMWHLWTWILMRANWKVGYVYGYEVLPGSLATSYEAIGRELNCKKSTIERRIKKLVSWGMISLNAGRNFTVITICNWKTYQHKDEEERDTDGTPVGHGWDANGTQAGNCRETNGKSVGTIEEIIEVLELVEGYNSREEIAQKIIHVAQQYCFLSTKKNKFGFPAETEKQVIPVLVELVRQSIPLSLIEEHVKNSIRNRNQPLWEFEREVRSVWKSQQPKPIEELSPAMRFLERMTGGSN